VTLSLIVNPFAGGGRAGRALPDVRAMLDALALEHHVHPTRGLDHARELARAAAAAGETAVAFGGDGLIGAVAEALKHGEGVIGVLPGGRGNDFARVLGIPQEPRDACGVLATGTVRALDLGQVDSRTFIGIASCGFDSVANRIANETRVVRGNLVYTYGAIRALAGWHPTTFTIRLDDGPTQKVTGYTVAAANSKFYGGGMMMAPDATLEDGLLDVVIISDMPKLRFIGLLPTVFKGNHVKHAGVAVLRCAKVEISTSRPFTMYADGDPIAELPATVSVLPGAIRAIVPTVPPVASDPPPAVGRA
jgi:YegS/Rv2252/BmrU family lipid kinase